ncbi:hypothetical protein V6Z12_D08G158600 [Gossypium hirsutum]
MASLSRHPFLYLEGVSNFCSLQDDPVTMNLRRGAGLLIFRGNMTVNAFKLMRISYSPTAHLFLFLVQWTDFHLAGALGLLRILI